MLLSEGVGGTFGRHTLFNTANPPRATGSHPRSNTQDFKRGVGTNDDTNWREKTKRTVKARTDCGDAFRSVVCIQHGIKKVLPVTCPHNVL